jgi:hypothetical protein
MKTFIVEVDLLGVCGDTFVYVVKEESNILAKKRVKNMILSVEENTSKYLQDLYVKSARVVRDNILEEYFHIKENASEEYIEEFLNNNVWEYSTANSIHKFTRKEIIKNFDEVIKVIIESAKIHSYEYAVEFAKITELSEESGIHYSNSIYNGC